MQMWVRQLEHGHLRKGDCRMLIRWLIAILLTLLALAVIDRASLVVAPCSEYRGAQYDHNEAEQKECTAGEGIVIAGVEWLADLKPEVWTALATLAIAAFTLTLWLSTDGMLRITKESIQLAREEFVATHRPRIFVWQVDFSDGSPTESEPITVAFRYVNGGDSTAYIHEIGVRLIPLEAPLLRSGISFKPEFIEPPITLESGSFEFKYLAPVDPSNPLITNALSGVHKLICVGYIVYKDGAGTIRHTGFCRQYDPSSKRWHNMDDAQYEYAY
jgi:hypothetical protein